jgi:hypothetical protein
VDVDVDAVLFAGAGPVPGPGVVPGEAEGALRFGRDEDEEDERDGGRELISGHILVYEVGVTRRVGLAKLRWLTPSGDMTA